MTASSATAPPSRANIVQPGQRLMAVVPLDAVYVDANFKETQLADLKPGQSVKVSVDAYPDLAISGHGREHRAGLRLGVQPAAARQRHRQLHQDRAARARSASASAGEAVAEGLIRPGMSVVASIDTRTAPTAVAAR